MNVKDLKVGDIIQKDGEILLVERLDISVHLVAQRIEPHMQNRGCNGEVKPVYLGWCGDTKEDELSSGFELIHRRIND